MKNVWMMAMAVTSVAFVACDKSENEVSAPVSVQKVVNLPADTTTGFSSTGRPLGANRFTYFSLRENKIITGADTLTNKWDIAFKQFFIKVNGGTSATGGGNGATFVANSTFENYTQVTEADTAFKQDNAPVWAINPMPGGWYTYSTSTFLAFPIPGKIFVIRTADGKYAKMEVTSFYRNGVAPDVAASPAVKALNQFFYQFRFSVQPNGTKRF